MWYIIEIATYAWGKQVFYVSHLKQFLPEKIPRESTAKRSDYWLFKSNTILFLFCFVLFIFFLFMLDLRQTKIGIAFAQVLEYRDYNWSMFYSFCTFSGFLFSKNIFKIIIWWEACFLQSCSHLLLGCRKRYQANNVLEVLFAFDFKIVIL